MAALSPEEKVRRLETFLRLTESHKNTEIAAELGLEPGQFNQWLSAVRQENEDLEELLEAYQMELFEEEMTLQRAVELDRQHKYRSKAAQELGVSWNKFIRLLERAAERGLDGSTPLRVPEGQVVKGISVMHSRNNETGEMEERMIWTKTKRDEANVELQLRLLAEELGKRVPARKPIDPPSGYLQEELADLIVIADGHIGALATMDETGSVWKLKEAERVLVQGMHRLMMHANRGRKLILVFLGDLKDYDSLVAVTPTSGHILASDSRFHEMVKATVRVVDAGVTYGLSLYSEVELFDMEGNHDLSSPTLRREIWTAAYKNEPRLTIHNSPFPYAVTVWGECMLGFHHGHLNEGDKLTEIFAAEFPKEWGTTKYRSIHIGHKHSRERDGERRGADVMRHPTLAGRSPWAARQAYRALRRAQRITYHKRFGEVNSEWITPDMLM